ncbi:MAG: aldo/keto reductase [Lachnospiraceae bacterium]|nr:aldo/keto reductase [Lachnospiraceae bacterium]
MQTRLLGRTGLRVTVAGLGCGGFSRIGIEKGVDHAAKMVRTAYDLGVNFFDTATVYGTQEAVGIGLQGIARDRYVLSTKFPYKTDQGLITPKQLESYLEESLRLLRTDYIDVYHIHALNRPDYDYAKNVLVPVMLRAKEQGKIRFLGVTEQFIVDTSHEMLKVVLPDNLFDVIMTGYNMLNPSAADSVLPLAVQNNIGVLCMFAVRQALHDPATLQATFTRMIECGQVSSELDAHTLDFLLEQGIAATLPEAAYRFCNHALGISVTLTGTGNPAHLSDNLRAIQAPPLPEEALKQLHKLFSKVDCVSGQ